MIVNLDRQVVIEQRSSATNATFGSSTNAWTLVATVWAERQDILPSRSRESIELGGLQQGRRLTRYRFRYRTDIDMTMRIREGTAVYHIVGGPAELGRREYLEVLAEQYTTDGTT